MKPLTATVAINSLVNECAFGAVAQKKATAANIKHKPFEHISEGVLKTNYYK